MFFDEILNGERRLEIGKLQVQRRRRTQERSAELADWYEAIAQQHGAVFGIDRLAPSFVGLPLFINRNAFAQPARHLVVGLGERDNVAILVVQSRLPAGGARALRRWAV